MTADGNNFIKFWPLDYYDDNGNSAHLTILYGTDIFCTYGMNACAICGGNADVTMDGELNVGDIIVVVSSIIDNSEYNCSADMNNDQVVDILDIIILLHQILEIDSLNGAFN